MKKTFIALALLICTASVANAHSTIYTDDLGRLHFLGKDPGSKAAQQSQNFANYNDSMQKDLDGNTIIYENGKTTTEEEDNNRKVIRTNCPQPKPVKKMFSSFRRESEMTETPLYEYGNVPKVFY